MLNCRQTSQLLSQSLDRPLSFRERLSLRLHLLMCGACRRFAKQLRFLRRAMAAMETRALADGRLRLGGRARERIKQAMRDVGKNNFPNEMR